MQLLLLQVPISSGLSRYDAANVRELAWQQSLLKKTNESSNGGIDDDEEQDVDVATRLVFLPRTARIGSNMVQRKELSDNRKMLARAASSSSSSSVLHKKARIAKVMDNLRTPSR
jgi:hypothetical protein|tara:strand:+ start:252 stop:596 length:345 start_codon:yes stop_codon:yes gene_type:complete